MDRRAFLRQSWIIGAAGLLIPDEIFKSPKTYFDMGRVATPEMALTIDKVEAIENGIDETIFYPSLASTESELFKAIQQGLMESFFGEPILRKVYSNFY